MTFKDYFAIPKVNDGFVKVWLRNFLHFRNTWTVSLFWILLEPLMYLGAIGYGLGSYVNNINGTSFIEFFFPGLLCTTVMMVSFFEGTYGNFSKLTYQKTYQTIMLTRIGPEEIVIGELLWAASKGFFAALGVAFVSAFFGLIDSYKIIPAFVILFLLAWAFSTIAMIVTSLARNYDSFIYFSSGFIIPMSLIAGTYYPVEQLPVVLRQFAYLLPLTHGVNSVRSILHSGFSWSVLINLCVLLIIGWVCTNISIHRIRKKLLK